MNLIEPWHRRHALQIVMQLPEGQEDAHLVLMAAVELVQDFLGGRQFALDLPGEPEPGLRRDKGVVLAFPAAAGSPSSF